MFFFLEQDKIKAGVFQMSRAVTVKITGRGVSYRGREGQTQFVTLMKTMQ